VNKIDTDQRYNDLADKIIKYQNDFYISNGVYSQLNIQDGIGKVHVYDGPHGHGYTIILEAEENGDQFHKIATHQGEEKYRESITPDWVNKENNNVGLNS